MFGTRSKLYNLVLMSGQKTIRGICRLMTGRVLIVWVSTFNVAESWQAVSLLAEDTLRQVRTSNKHLTIFSGLDASLLKNKYWSESWWLCV